MVLGAEAQSVAVGWQVYQITNSALSLGYTGLALFLPGLFFVLPAGHIADRYDKRRVILACYMVQAICTAALLWISLHGIRSILPIYGVLFLIGMGRCFSGPAASALVPMLVPEGDFVNAVTWGATVFQVANATGPMFGGLLFTLTFASLGRWRGAPLVYVFTLAMMLAFLALVGAIRVRALVRWPQESLQRDDRFGWAALRAAYAASPRLHLARSLRRAAWRGGCTDAHLRS